MEAPKAALPARPALIQQLAAIDLVFENFGFKSGGRKNCSFSASATSSIQLINDCIILNFAQGVLGCVTHSPSSVQPRNSISTISIGWAKTWPRRSRKQQQPMPPRGEARLGTSRTPLVRRTRIGRSVVSPKKRLFDRSGVHQMPRSAPSNASSRIACGMTVCERPFHPFVPVTPSEPVNTSRRATKNLEGTNLTGSIAWKDGKPLPQLHPTISWRWRSGVVR